MDPCGTPYDSRAEWDSEPPQFTHTVLKTTMEDLHDIMLIQKWFELSIKSFYPKGLNVVSSPQDQVS